MTLIGVCDKVNEQLERVFNMPDKNDKVILTCSVCLSRNYTTTRNKSTQPQRLSLNKYCKTCGKHTEHKETK